VIYIESMMKRARSIVLAVILVFGAAVTVSARGAGFAIGGEGALYLAGAGGLPMSAMLTFHIPQVPLMFAVGVQSPFAVAATADYWAAHGSVTSIFSWYAGVGAYLYFDVGPGGTIGAGGRIPIGLQAWPFRDVLELFVEIAPAVGVILVPTGFDWHLQGAVGLRIWL
jgi:hypothetical protein